MAKSATRTDAAAPRGTPPALGADSRLARRSRVASAGLVLILLTISVFTISSAFARSSAASEAARASRVSEDYQPGASASLGMNIVRNVVMHQLGGTIELRRDGGTSWVIRIPNREKGHGA